jgi:predicted porin
MRKTIALTAALAVCGGAFAQSSVTIYGVLDIGIGKVKGGRWGLNNGEGYALQAASSINGAAKDGFNSTSVIGFRGTEDLGGGLRANFNLQTGGLDLSTGGAGVTFGREAWVGLESSSLGAIQFGRTASVAAKTMASYDLNGTSFSSPLQDAGISAATWYGSSRRSEQIQYGSPNMGGVVIRAGFTPKGDAAPNGVSLPNTAKGSVSASASYQSGPLSISAVAESKRSAALGMRTAYAVGFLYDLSVVKLVASLNRRELGGKGQNVGWNPFQSGGLAGGGGKGFAFGAQAPIGPANVGLQFARNSDTDVKAFELYASYALSKRTRMYADFGKLSGVRAVAAIASTVTVGGSNAIPNNPYVFGTGIVHTF